MKFTTMIPTTYNDATPVKPSVLERLIDSYWRPFRGGTREGLVTGHWIDDDGTEFTDLCVKFSVECDRSRLSDCPISHFWSAVARHRFGFVERKPAKRIQTSKAVSSHRFGCLERKPAKRIQRSKAVSSHRTPKWLMEQSLTEAIKAVKRIGRKLRQRAMWFEVAGYDGVQFLRIE